MFKTPTKAGQSSGAPSTPRTPKTPQTPQTPSAKGITDNLSGYLLAVGQYLFQVTVQK